MTVPREKTPSSDWRWNEDKNMKHGSSSYEKVKLNHQMAEKAERIYITVTYLDYLNVPLMNCKLQYYQKYKGKRRISKDGFHQL